MRTLGWAFYLACSWTWCIGMFLPVLLVRDYGIWGFVAFAVPNVVGAGAMGWVLRTPGASETIVREHGGACVAFSWVTVVFQLVFIGWIIGQKLPDVAPPPSNFNYVLYGAIPVGVLLAYAAWGPRPRWWPAVALWFFSMAAFAMVLISQSLIFPDPSGVPVLAWVHEGDPDRAVWLAPVCIFGFALCPYLDLTFHRARQAMGDDGRAAFGLGFGVLFTPMIVFTLVYAGWFLFYRHRNFVSYAAMAVIVHVLLQVAFTATIHANEVTLWVGERRRALVAGVLGVVLAGIGILVAKLGAVHAGLEAGEVVYRCFMAFYGLIFPAYVWLLMIPTRDGHSGLGGENGRRKMLIWAGAVGMAAPMFWMGFIEREEFWLVPGLGVVLGARLVLPRGRIVKH